MVSQLKFKLTSLDKSVGSIIRQDGEIDDDVNHRKSKLDECKWRKASRILYEKKTPHKVKGKFYRTTIKPVVLYINECWAMMGQQELKMG